MKKTILVAFSIFFISIFFVSSVYSAEIKLGVIDTQKIMALSKAAKEARTVFFKDLEEKRNLLFGKQKEAQLLEEELNNKGKDMAPSVLREKADKLTQEVKELKRMKAELEQDLKSKEMELSRNLLREIGEIVNVFSKKEKYTLIFERSTIIASDDAIDITDQIIKLYDAGK